MDPIAILEIIEKGVTVISALVEAEKGAEPAIKATLALIAGAKAGTVTQEDLDATEALLDQQIDDFNLDL